VEFCVAAARPVLYYSLQGLAMNNMNRRQFWERLAAGGTAVTVHGWLTTAATSKPNIVLILMDDMGAKDPACFGSDFYETPNIDRLAREGMKFTQAYANAPNCAPTRACLMTGQYTPRHGVYTVGSSERGKAERRRIVPTPNTETLPAEKVTIAESLRAAGYSTFHGGKWHLGAKSTGPEGQGFDVNVGGFTAGSPPGGYFAPWKAPGLTAAPEGAHLCDYVTDQALAFIREHQAGPFFVYLPFYDVHAPLQAKPALVEKYRQKKERVGQTKHRNAVYAAMVGNSDTNIGRVLKTLDDLGLAENTVVIFWSDNGGFGGATSQRPLRGCKGMLYEGGVRVPGIVRWTGKIAAGSTCATPAITSDFYPTLLNITGASRPPAEQPLDGVSLEPLLAGGTIPDRPLFWHVPCYLEGIPEGFEQDAPDPEWRAVPAGSVRQGDWKLIESFDTGRLELYNLASDPSERKNLAVENAGKMRELHEVMKQWRQRVNAPVPTTPEPRYRASSE